MMTEEYVGPEVSHAIHARAKRKCECENIRCKHVAGHCRIGLDSYKRDITAGRYDNR